MRFAVALAVCACGRVNFDARSDDGSVGDGSQVNPDLAPGAETETFGETGDATTPATTRDTFLEGGGGTNLNHGTSPLLESQTSPDRTPLLFVDLTAIPPGATVISASLQLTATVVGNSHLAGLFRILEAWDEGTSDGADGVANFDDRQIGVPWSGQGCLPPSRNNGSSALFSPTTPKRYVIDLPIALVQDWVTDPSTNFGVAIRPTASNASFVSSNGTPAGDRPLWTVTYTP